MEYNDSAYTARRELKINIAYSFLDCGSYFSLWRIRSALNIWTVWPTFRIIFEDGKLVGGSKDLSLILKEIPRFYL